MCGSNEFVKKKGIYVCSYCGTNYSIEEKIQNNITLSDEISLDNLLGLARDSAECYDFASARDYYNDVLSIATDNVEAIYHSLLFSLCSFDDNETFTHFEDAYSKMLSRVLDAMDSDTLGTFIPIAVNNTSNIAAFLFHTSIKPFNNPRVNKFLVESPIQVTVDSDLLATILYKLADEIHGRWPGCYNDLVCPLWEQANVYKSEDICRTQGHLSKEAPECAIIESYNAKMDALGHKDYYDWCSIETERKSKVSVGKIGCIVVVVLIFVILVFLLAA